MGCRPIILGPKEVRILRAPSSASPAEVRRARARDGLGRFAKRRDAAGPALGPVRPPIEARRPPDASIPGADR